MKAMFSTEIVGTDAFKTMPKSTQLLYFHLGMEVDDDGFVGNPMTIMRSCGCSNKDYKMLIEKRFIIVFESEICVIKHHWINNTKRSDRYSQTKYQKEYGLIIIKENKAYTEKNKPSTSEGNQVATSGIPVVDQWLPQEKGREEKLTEEKRREERGDATSRFSPPPKADVENFINENNYVVDPDRFIAYYESNGWKVGKNPMKSWQATVRNWHYRDNPKPVKTKTGEFSFVEEEVTNG